MESQLFFLFGRFGPRRAALAALLTLLLFLLTVKEGFVCLCLCRVFLLLPQSFAHTDSTFDIVQTPRPDGKIIAASVQMIVGHCETADTVFVTEKLIFQGHCSYAGIYL